MIVDIVMPKMGESINEGTILEWRKKIGEKIQLDEILLEIGTDKVDSEIPSPAEGVLKEILAEPNDVVEVGIVIAKIDTEQKNNAVLDNENDLIEKANLNKKNKENESNKKTSNKQSKFYSPVVMKIIAENNFPIDELKNVNGSGRNGRVTKKDILQYIKQKELAINNETSIPKKEIEKIDLNSKIDNKIIKKQKDNIQLEGRVEEINHMRKLISNHMRESIETSAHVYLMTEIDMTSIADFVKLENKMFFAKEGFNLTYTPFIIKSTIKALEEHPLMNSSLIENSIHYHKNINIGLAVSVDEGLLVPTIYNCEEKSFLGICRSINDVATRSREKTISSDELSGSTFSITNFGVFGVSMGTPIINQPNVGILGIGAIKKMPVVVESLDGDDTIGIRSIMMVTLGFDHRLIDGSGGASFLKSIRENIENINLESLL